MDPFQIALLLYVAAIAVALLDLFIPSGGILLVMAALAAIACVLFGFRSGQSGGMLMLMLVLGSVPAFAFTAIKIWPNTPIGRRIILQTPSSVGEAYAQATLTDVAKLEGQDDFEALQSAQPTLQQELAELVGCVFTADAPLMPSGSIRIGTRQYNVVAESGYIEAGQNFEVIRHRVRELVVRVTNLPASQPAKPQALAATAESEQDLLALSPDELGLDLDLGDSQTR